MVPLVRPPAEFEYATADEPEPRAVPPDAGRRVPKESVQLPGLVALYRNHPVVAKPFGLADPLSVADVVVIADAALVVTVGGGGGRVAMLGTLESGEIFGISSDVFIAK